LTLGAIIADPAARRKTAMPRLCRLAVVTLCVLPIVATGAPWRAHEGNSPGWRYLSPAERVEHQRRLRGFTSLADCKAYLAQHHRLIAERAQRAGQNWAPHAPDTCDRLRQEGRLS
jgi:hypothetical protein